MTTASKHVISLGCDKCNSHHGTVSIPALAVAMAMRLELWPLLNETTELEEQAKKLRASREVLLSRSPASLVGDEEFSVSYAHAYQLLWLALDQLLTEAEHWPRATVRIREERGPDSIWLDPPATPADQAADTGDVP